MSIYSTGKWVAISTAYGNYEVEGTFKTKKAAVEKLSSMWGCEMKKTRSYAGFYEYNGRHIVIPVDMMKTHGYELKR